MRAHRISAATAGAAALGASAFCAAILIQSGAVHAKVPAGPVPANPVNDYVSKLSPQARAAWLARTVGAWCIGNEPFLMGVAQTGASSGYAYWSFNCVGYGSYVLQITPQGHGEVIDCKTFNEQAGGKECFKKF